MSKSRSNIIYPRDLIKQGCEWNSIRFFLIYGHYRKKLNFTWARYKKACEKLQQFQSMVKNLGSIEITSKKASQKTKKLVAKLKTDFESNMNNDLYVKHAFDALFSTVSKLVTLREKGKFNAEDARQTIANLKKIDQVLQVIF